MPMTTPAFGMRTSTGIGEQKWYRLVRRLATRASSELALVYVPDGTSDRLAVLKRLPAQLATDAAAVEKFRVEARIAAMLEHPSIVKVFEIVETPSEDFYTMEYVRGTDCRRLMDVLVAQRKTLPLDCVLLIAIELCNALDYAHHLGDTPVIHRELSPSKVLLGNDGAIKLTGFGAPALPKSRPRRSRTESIGYTSPERCLGEATDSRSDLFALGVLLYELSSGEQLFADATTEYQIMARIVRGDLPRPSEIRRGYPRELERILMRALARDPKERYQTASELQTELETFLWSRWPTASTSALAKLVSTAFPEEEELATGSTELERIDPFNQTASPPTDDPVLWLGPVPLAKPYPKLGEVQRPSTRELQRVAPKKFAEASNCDVALGKPGPKPNPDDLKRAHDERSAAVRRAASVLVQKKPIRPQTDLAIAIEEIPDAPVDAPKDVQLGTPGVKPSPLGAERALSFDAANDEAPRGQYQRPEALDENAPSDNEIIEKLRAKARNDERVATPGAIARVALTRVATPVGLVRADIVREKKPEPVETRTTESIDIPIDVDEDLNLDRATETTWTLIARRPPVAYPAVFTPQPRLPSPPPSAIAGRRWPIATITAIVCVVVIGVLLSTWAIKHTVHEPSQLPEVVVAQPSPPTDVVLRTTKRVVPEPAAPVAKQKPRVATKKPPAAAPPTGPFAIARSGDSVGELPQADPGRKPPPLFPPDEIATTLPGAIGSLDGLPSIAAITTKGVSEAPVRKAIEQLLSPLRGCYRAAARARQMTPPVQLTLTFEVDKRRLPTKVRAVGGGPLDDLAPCAAKVTSEMRDLPAVAGSARVTVQLDLKPNP